MKKKNKDIHLFNFKIDNYHVVSVKGLKGTVVNQAYLVLIRGSLEITTTVFLNL